MAGFEAGGSSHRGAMGRARVAPAAAAHAGRDRSRSQGRSQGWLIVFTDLVALLLAFFVLLFSMSRVEHQQWRYLVDSLAQDLNDLNRVEKSRPAVDLQIEQPEEMPGADLDYLASVLHDQITADGILGAAALRRFPDRLIISLPAEVIFLPRTVTLAPQAKDAVMALSGILRNLENAVEIEGHSTPHPPARGFSSNWELTLARAAILSRMLAGAGLRRLAVARGYGDTRGDAFAGKASGRASSLAGERMEVVIREQTREPLK